MLINKVIKWQYAISSNYSFIFLNITENVGQFSHNDTSSFNHILPWNICDEKLSVVAILSKNVMIKLSKHI